jgi:type I restriction enzyme S subunit
MSKIEELIKEFCPDGVNTGKLISVANIQNGFAFDSKLFTTQKIYIPLIRIRDVVPAKAGTYYKGSILEPYIIKKGDILVGMDGNFNIGKWNDVDGLLNQRVCKIYSKDESKFVLNFTLNLPNFKTRTPMLKLYSTPKAHFMHTAQV